MRRANRALLALLALLILATAASAQQQLAVNNQPAVREDKSTAANATAPAPVEPRYGEKIYQVALDGSLVLLESQQPFRNVKVGLTSGSVVYEYTGLASTARITTRSPVFVLRLPSDVDPTTVIYALNLTKVTKKGREIVMVEAKNSLKGFKDSGKRPENFEFTCSENGPNSVKITVKETLAPGEYGFRTKFGTFLFGVD